MTQRDDKSKIDDQLSPSPLRSKTCKIAGCNKPHYSRGWCQMHYRRWTRTGSPLHYATGQKVEELSNA